METIQPVTFTYDEIMLCVASEQIRDREVALIGTGLPMLAATLAKQVHAPRAVMIYESGLVDTNPVEVPVSVADPRIMFGTTTFSSLYKTLGLLQRFHRINHPTAVFQFQPVAVFFILRFAFALLDGFHRHDFRVPHEGFRPFDILEVDE